MEQPYFDCPCCKRRYFKSRTLIDCGKSKYVQVDKEDYEELTKYKWHLNPSGYPARCESGKDGKRRMIYMHRQIMHTPADMVVDHINGDKLDNRRSNLRNCTIKENMRNTKRKNGKKHHSSIYKGVSRFKGRDLWALALNRTLIGYFKNERHAAIAYDLWAVDLYGDFARTNFKVVAHS